MSTQPFRIIDRILVDIYTLGDLRHFEVLDAEGHESAGWHNESTDLTTWCSGAFKEAFAQGRFELSPGLWVFEGELIPRPHIDCDDVPYEVLGQWRAAYGREISHEQLEPRRRFA